MAASRQAFTAAGLGPEDLLQAAENARDRGSPLGVTPDVLEDRAEWLEDDYEVDLPMDREQAEVLLTVSSIELMKYPKSIVAMARLLNQAGVDWTFSTKGYESTNFGFLSGRTDIAKLAIERLVSAAEAIGAKTLVIPECGHAYGVLRWSGANILGRPLPFDVVHITEYLAALKREGKELPPNAAVDKDGNPTTDPHKVAALTPFGTHKGYGIALVIDVLTGVLMGAEYGPHITAMYGDYDKPRKLASTMIAIDPDTYAGFDHFIDKMDAMVDDLHAQPPAPGFEQVLVPGEIEWQNEKYNREHGVPVLETIYQYLKS